MLITLRVLLAVALAALVGLLTGFVPMGFVWVLLNVVVVGLLVLGVAGVVRMAERSPLARRRP